MSAMLLFDNLSQTLIIEDEETEQSNPLLFKSW